MNKNRKEYDKKYHKQYYKQNRESLLQKSKQWANENKVYRKTYFREYNKKLKLDVLSHYSNGKVKCICCKEKLIGFLTIDHMNNNGKAQRKRLTNNNKMHFYKWLKNNKYPQNLDLYVMCYNCNIGRSRNNNICPHKQNII